ncbi:MAG TPA: hypothetical protein VHM93_15060 [Candidatus Acidoferrum sp.]|jgi:hypothetical protein|nr:hypothetical protein [Candidatus Acidoferrum sp.]
MAAEEDKKFDAVLGGFLVNDLRARAGNLHCPDSDVLAAYHEQSLLPEEMNSWKEHIVGCARCQAVLAELEATEAIPLRAPEEAFEKEEALLPKSAEPPAVAREAGKPAPAKFPEKPRIREISRGVRWQWLAPAGALAAALLVWVAWHENQPLPWKTPAEVKTAERERSSPSATPPAPRRETAPSPPSDQTQTSHFVERSKDQAAAGETLSAEETRMSEALKQLEKREARVRRAPSANKQRVLPKDAAEDLTAGAAQSQEPKPGLAAATDGVAPPTETTNAQMQAQQSPLSAQKSAAPIPLPEAEKKSKTESPGPALRPAVAAPPSPSASGGLNGNLRASHALMARASDLHLIDTPSKKTRWRAGRAGMIEFSSDGGVSWSPQTSNVLVDLTAGSAPSEKVCWIVGRAGTILLTTDAGAHWALLHSPLEEDLGGVRATDALRATIWNLGNSKVFETADGGLTWSPATSQ